FLFSILSVITLNGQWISLNPHPTANNTYIGSAPSSDRFITVSAQGEAVLTHDGGATWQVLPFPLDGIYRACYFLNENVGWAVGAIGSGQVRIVKSTNGGLNWTQQTNAPDTTKYDVFFINENVGWIVGFYGMILKTTDGGITWTPSTTKPGQSVWGIHIARSLNGTIAMTACASGYVYKSIDGGANWVPEPRLTINTFDDIYMTPNASHAWVVGSSGTTIKWVNPDVVPVELTSFKAALNGNAVLLNWSTASELNNAGFEIERSLSELSSIDVVKKSSNQWKKIGFVQGNGTTLEFKSYQFNDELNDYGTFNYRLKQIDFDGSFTYSNIVEIDNILPQQFSLFQNYPNPFNPETNISFTLPTEGIVNLKIFDVLGNEVAQLINEFKSPGKYTVSYQSGSHSPIASGVYLYRLELNSENKGKQSLIRKMILIK
ncbi:MAG: YCF48-related protein, partial [Ignavibacteriaceae bacterium]|nr:YCF48-related protein [Ignavibacteriaceae bacterium]